MTKKFEAYGICHPDNIRQSAESTNSPIEQAARGFTYTDRNNDYPSTRLAFPQNPFNEDVLNAKYILDVGMGTGRNIPWICDNTNATYVGIDPSPIMRDNVWKVIDPKYQPRTIICGDWSEISTDIIFDVVISTFVFQHLGYRNPPEVMNVTDITKEIFKHTRVGTVWILYEHEVEERWISRWMKDNDINPQIIDLHSNVWPELTHRGSQAHLIIWKQDHA